MKKQGFPGGSAIKDLPANACQCGRHRFDPWVGKIPWRRKWLPTPVFLPEKCCRQRSLMGYSPLGHKGLDTTWQLHNEEEKNIWLIFHLLELPCSLYQQIFQEIHLFKIKTFCLCHLGLFSHWKYVVCEYVCVCVCCGGGGNSPNKISQ